MGQNVFLKLRYVGPRFESSSIPLSYLGELGALQTAVFEMYRFKYRLQNSRRAPNGYRDALTLSLRGIEAGSAIACLEPPLPFQETLDDEMSVALSGSIQDFLNFIEGDCVALPRETQRTMARCVKELGSSLQDDESIYMERGDRRVLYNQEVRRTLLGRLKEQFSRTEEKVFAVSEFDKIQKSFQLCSPEEHRLPFSTSDNSAWEKLATEAFDGFCGLDRNTKVLVSGMYTYDGEGRITKVQAESFEILGDRDLRWRIPYLIHKNIGNRTAIKTLTDFELMWAAHFHASIVEHPALYLLGNDKVSAEWDLGDGELSMTIGLNIHLLQLGAIEQEEILERDKLGEAAEWVASRIKVAAKHG